MSLPRLARGLRGHLPTLVTALVLAGAAALIARDGLASKSAVAPPPAVSRLSPPALQYETAPGDSEYVLYLVREELQASLLRQRLLETATASLSRGWMNFGVQVVDSEQAEQRAQAMIVEMGRELMSAGSSFRVIDLRTSTPHRRGTAAGGATAPCYFRAPRRTTIWRRNSVTWPMWSRRCTS